MNHSYSINSPHIISESMEEELVVINLESGCYYSLDPMATLLWTQLEKGSTIECLSRHFKSDAPEETLKEITTFVSFLLEEELITEDPESDYSVGCGLDESAAEFKAPLVQKFTDMQEMLLLDPIHEVSDMGWPHESK